MVLFRTSSVLLLLLLCALPAVAQTSTDDDDDPLLRGSNRALIFSLDELKLGTVNGGIGLRWWLSQNSALRTTFLLRVESTEDIVEGSIDLGRSAFGAGGSILIEWHTHQFRRVSPYIAAGAGVTFDAFSETTDFAPDSPLQRRRDKGTTIDFIVDAGFGVEVYLAKSVSISAEHLFRASVRSTDGTETNTFLDAPQTVFKRDGTQFLFGTGTSSLILAVYF